MLFCTPKFTPEPVALMVSNRSQLLKRLRSEMRSGPGANIYTTLHSLSVKMEFDLRMADRWAFTLPFLSETPTHFHLWGGKKNFSVQAVLLGLCYFHGILVIEDYIQFFSLIYGFYFWLLINYDIHLNTKWKYFPRYLQLILLVCFLQARTGNLYVSLYNTALSEHSIQGAFFNQDSDCVLYLLVCSIFIVILAAGINLCRGIRIWGNNKQTDCL